MNKVFLAAASGAALLSLGACNNDPDEVEPAAEGDTTIIEDTAPAPTVTETTTVIDERTVDTDPDAVDGEPDVEATIGPDPSATIRTD